MSRKIIAIIGATGKTGSLFSKSLAKSNYRLLLFDHETEKLTALVNEIKRNDPSSDIEFMSCEGDASWEADIIVPDIPAGQEKELAQKIAPFSNRKIVLNISKNSAAHELQKFLPGASVINVIEDKNRELLIDGNDDGALKTAAEILASAGYIPVVTKTLNSTQIFSIKK